MAKAREFSKAKLLYGAVAYCDQWRKVMAVYDSTYGSLIAFIKKHENIYYVLLLGDDDETMLFYTRDIELGTTAKNMESCFALYRMIRDSLPYIKYKSHYGKRSLYEYFTHTRVSAIRSGGFTTSNTWDCQSEIAEAEKKFDELITDSKMDNAPKLEDEWAGERASYEYSGKYRYHSNEYGAFGDDFYEGMVADFWESAF